MVEKMGNTTKLQPSSVELELELELELGLSLAQGIDFNDTMGYIFCENGFFVMSFYRMVYFPVRKKCMLKVNYMHWFHLWEG